MYASPRNDGTDLSLTRARTTLPDISLKSSSALELAKNNAEKNEMIESLLLESHHFICACVRVGGVCLTRSHMTVQSISFQSPSARYTKKYFAKKIRIAIPAVGSLCVSVGGRTCANTILCKQRGKNKLWNGRTCSPYSNRNGVMIDHSAIGRYGKLYIL